MRVRVLTSAFNDLEAGRKFYNKQGTGIGEYFFDSIFSDIDSLMLYGGIHSKKLGFHRFLASRFPYAIYYKVSGNDTVDVYRILDCRQDPAGADKALRKASKT